jgi:hypothetical protein
VLAVNVEDLDIDARHVPGRSKGGDTEWIYWGPGTAHLLPRLLRGRESGPVFLTARRPSPARRPGARDLCPTTGRTRLGYDRARLLFASPTRMGTPPVAPLGRHLPRRAGASLQLITAKTRINPRAAMHYIKPGGQAVAGVTELLRLRRRG